MTISYRNTDLDVTSAEDLAPLVKAFQTHKVFPSYASVILGSDGNWHANFETDGQYQIPESNIKAMLNVIESLSESLQLLWKTCDLREFNIGYDCGTEPWAFNNGISNQTLQRMATAGTTLRITIYPFVDGNADGV